MPRTPNLIPALAITALVLNACSESKAPLATAPAADLALSTTLGNPAGFPPDDWVFLPAELGPGFTQWECTFPFPPTLNPRGGPNAACQEKQWGESGIFREQIRDLDIISFGDCGGGVAHFDEIRVCSKAWIDNPSTPWGEAGPLGCVRVNRLPTICGA